jgi:hypothetical protein
MGPHPSETASPRQDPRHSWAVVGAVVAGVLATVLHLLGVDGVEVVATLLFAVVFVVTLLWGRLAGFAAAALATLAYAFMRRHALDEAGTPLYAVVVAGRAASYLVLAHVTHLVVDKLPRLPLSGLASRAVVAGQAAPVTEQNPSGAAPAPAAPLGHHDPALAAVTQAPYAPAPPTARSPESWSIQPDLEFDAARWPDASAEEPGGEYWPEPGQEPAPWGAGDPGAPAFSGPWTDLEPEPEAEGAAWSEQWSEQWSEPAADPAAWPGQWAEPEGAAWSEQWSQQWSGPAAEPERAAWSDQWWEPQPERDGSSGPWPEADQEAWSSAQWPEPEPERAAWSEQWSQQPAQQWSEPWSEQPPPSWEGNEAPLERVLPPSWEGGFDDDEAGWDPRVQGVPFDGAVEGLVPTDDIPPPSHAPPAPAGPAAEPMEPGNAPWLGGWPADEHGPASREPSWAAAPIQPHHAPPAPPGIDPGTGLQTAEYLRDRLAAEWETSRSRKSPFSVVMVQIPDIPFQALPELRRATLLRELGHQFTEAGMVDHLVHLPDGGRHWFAVVLGDTDKSGARAFERRLRMAIAGYLRNRGLRLEDVSSASLTSPDDDETMVGMWSSLLGEPVRGR